MPEEDMMSKRLSNSGIYVAGQGSINADQIAVGRYARAQKVVLDAGSDLERRGWKDVQQKLEQLLAVASEKAGEIKDGDEVMTAVEQVAVELKRDKPSRLTVKSLLDGIAEHAGSVTPAVPNF
jgi:hypothetical protein